MVRHFLESKPKVCFKTLKPRHPVAVIPGKNVEANSRNPSPDSHFPHIFLKKGNQITNCGVSNTENGPTERGRPIKCNHQT